MRMILLLLLLAGCLPSPPVALPAEQAYPLCQAAALPELRRTVPAASAVTLHPLPSASVERRAVPSTAGEGVALVIKGRAIGAAAGQPGGFRYTCLLGTRGRVVYLDIEPDAGGEAPAECQGEGGAACLRTLAREAEADLAQAEAQAVKAARATGRRRAAVDEPAAVSIGAWRVYRDAECERRAGPDADREAACRIELTRRRIAELRG